LQTGEQLGEVDLWVDFEPLAGIGHSADDRGSFAAADRAHEQGVFAEQGNSLHLLLGQIVVDRDGHIGREQGQLLPLVERVTDHLGHRVLGQEPSLLIDEDCMQ